MAKKFLSDIELDAGLVDVNGNTGTSGQILSSTGESVDWIDNEVEVAKSLQVTVKNISGAQLTKGTVVHASPSANPPNGNVIEVIAADNDDPAKMPAIGILNETIADEAEGEAIMMGALSGIDTDSFAAGDELYVGADGALTNAKPADADELIQKIAVVIKSHASNGLIKIFGAGRSNDIPNVGAATTDTDKFVVLDSGTLKYRTGAEIISDLPTDTRYVAVTGDTMTGTLTASGGINGLTLSNGISGSNFNITGVNQLTINDPGEGIAFGGGSAGTITLAVVDDSNDNLLRVTGTNAKLQVGTNEVFHDGYHPNADTWTTGRTITIGGTGKAVNGSADVSWSLSEIGAAASSHNHDSDYVNVTGDAMTGKLGIGTSGPPTAYSLQTGSHILSGGSIYIGSTQNQIFDYSGDLHIYAGSGNNIFLGGGIGSVQNDVFIGNGTFRVNGSTRMGTGNPTEKLDVDGNVKADGFTSDGNAYSYTWRALDNTASSGIRYQKIARITSSQSSRFVIELAGRSTSYSNPLLPALGYIVGQLNNDNDYDLAFYNHSGEDTVVDEVGQVDVSTTQTDIYIKVSSFSEVTAHAHISDGSIAVESTSAGGTEPSNYVAATNIGVWNSRNDGAGSGLDADLLDGQQASDFASASHNHDSDYVNITGDTMTGDLTVNSDFFVTGSAFEISAGVATDFGGEKLSNIGAPTSVNDATTKTYVDNALASKLSTTGKAADSNLLDGIDSASFLRSDSADTATGTISFAAGVNIVANPLRFQRSLTSQTGQDDNVSVTVDDSNIYFTHNNDADGDASGFNFRYSTGGTTANLLNFSASSLTYKGNTIWHAGNDGAGSGLDADLLDGKQPPTNFSATSQTYTTIPDGGWSLPTGSSVFSKSDSVGGVGDDGYWFVTGRRDVNGGYSGIYTPHSNGTAWLGMSLTGTANPTWWKIWTSGNDGPGSGLDADTLDGQEASAFANSSHTHTWADISGETANSVNSWGGLRHQTNDGYIDFGPANTYHAHIYTDRPNFYLNKPLTVSGSTIINSGDIRSNIFYDLNNTAYYVDPSSTGTSAKFAGKVGIGTTNPNQKLTIKGTDQYVAAEQTNYVWGGTTTIGVRMGTDATAGLLDFRRWIGTATTHGTALITQVNSDGGYGLDFRVDTKTSNTVATTSRMFLSQSGEVGIGTTSPTEALDVNGSIASNATIYTGFDSGVTNSVSCSNWFRSSGSSGWFNSTYSGGIHMTDSTWVRVYNNKKFYNQNTIESNSGMYAPIFYDRNNTLYRFNGDASKDGVDLSTSGNYAIHVLGTISGGHRKHANLETPEMEWSVGGSTDLNWKKLCDIVISDGNYSGWGAEIEITNFSGNFGSATYDGGELFKGALSIYHWGGTGFTPETAYANIPYEMRSYVRWYKINETGQNRYELQVKSPANYQQLNVKVKPGIANQLADIISYANDTNGSTSGGTAYSSTQSSTFNHEFSGGIWTNEGRNIGWKNAYGSPYLSSYYGSITTSGTLYVGGVTSTTTSLYAGPVHGTIFYERSNTAYYMDGSSTGDSIRVAGDVVAFYSSDKRYKENIKPIENALDKVKAINGVTFNWNEKSHKETGKKDVGVIAQEVEEVFPEIVETRRNGYKAVDYQKLTAVLIESVKELTAKVEALEAKQCNCK